MHSENRKKHRKFKETFMKKLTDELGMTKKEAEAMYVIFLDTMVDCLVDFEETFIEKIGRMRFYRHMHEYGNFIQFRPDKYIHDKIVSKRKHMKKKFNIGDTNKPDFM